MPFTWVTVAIHTGYGQTGAVYTRQSGSVQIQPDRPPISVRTRIGSNSNYLRDEVNACWRQIRQLAVWHVMQQAPSGT